MSQGLAKACLVQRFLAQALNLCLGLLVSSLVTSELVLPEVHPSSAQGAELLGQVPFVQFKLLFQESLSRLPPYFPFVIKNLKLVSAIQRLFFWQKSFRRDL